MSCRRKKGAPWHGNNRSAWLRVMWVYGRLLTSKRPLTAKQLAEEWETSIKSIQRDIETLRQVGLDIKSNRDGYCYGLGYSLLTKICPMCGKLHKPGSMDLSGRSARA